MGSWSFLPKAIFGVIWYHLTDAVYARLLLLAAGTFFLQLVLIHLLCSWSLKAADYMYIVTFVHLHIPLKPISESFGDLLVYYFFTPPFFCRFKAHAPSCT
ncbi:hypothetical protein ASPCADRAFT_125503 [Aspergillus carbonarius ITEM 5010]|uniref:Uncharacterized protein n=1 Tax=Aspergillus carbonarius (strain ITEM 5010) TaxID=602072 RepID=A0A1R3S1A4_ASPC5|nr:hypothetical protein ASPCADRAFT_125503 [Aspergillus carbonarius ITEM 5010]